MAKPQKKEHDPLMPLLALLLAVDVPENPSGIWTNPSGSVTIEIAQCGTAYCGTVVAASEKAKADAARGGTGSLIGATLLSGFEATGDGRWKGQLFVPDINRRTKADISLTNDKSLKVRGCAVGRTLCKSQLWTRAD